MTASTLRSLLSVLPLLLAGACGGGLTVEAGRPSAATYAFSGFEPAGGSLVRVAPDVACERSSGRCFRIAPSGGSRFGFDDRSVFEDRFGLEDRFGFGDPFERSFGFPSRSSGDRFVRTGRRVVCDRGTEVCYKRGRIDQSETRDAFGRSAARRADRVRDSFPDRDVFVARGGRACDRDAEVCFKNGRPDRSDTRDVFGKSAARRLD